MQFGVRAPMVHLQYALSRAARGRLPLTRERLVVGVLGTASGCYRLLL